MRLMKKKYGFDSGGGPHCLNLGLFRCVAGAFVMVAGLGGGMDAVQAAALDTRAATCVANNGGLKGPKSKITYDAFNRNMWMRTLRTPDTTYKVPSSAVRGQVLFSTTEDYLPNLHSKAQQGQAAVLYNCPSGSVERFTAGAPRVASFTDVHQTTVPGIGYRVYYYITDDRGSEAAPSTFTNDFTTGVLVYPFNGSSDVGTNVRTRIDFIATGEKIVPGTIHSYSVFGQSTGPIEVSGRYVVRLGNDISITSPTCEVKGQSVVTAKLPDIKTSDLASSQLGPETALDILVDCSSPSQSGPTIKITPFEPVASSKNILGNMKTGVAAAKGVGVQLQLINRRTEERVDVIFDQAQDVAFARYLLPTPYWLYSLGLRFVRTGDASEVRAGEVEAKALLTFTYS